MKKLLLGVISSLLLVSFVGCQKPKEETAASPSQQTNPPVFKMAWNQYPSSSVYALAEQLGLINGKQGEQGTLEKKWNIDLVLKETDYTTQLTLYGQGQADAVTIVNLDALTTAAGRPGVAILPVSTSKGGDAIVVSSKVHTLDDLRSIPTHGGEKSVSEYLFDRALEVAGKNPAEFKFLNMDTEPAAQALQSGQADMDSVCIFNPYILNVLNGNKNAHVLVGSEVIPDEIVDVIWAGQDSMKKPGGDRFGALVADIYYEVNRRLADPAQRQDLLAKLGAKTNGVSGSDMEKEILPKTVFYSTPEQALNLLGSKDWQTKNAFVTKWVVDHKMVDAAPTVGYDTPAQVLYTTQYIKMAQNGK